MRLPSAGILPYHFAFVIEQALGHVTHGQNLQRVLLDDPQVHAEWVLPSFHVSGLAGRLPLYRSNWTVRAGLRTRRGLAALGRRPQALFFHTQVTAVLAPDWLRRFPSIVSLDATPLQYDQLGDFYRHAAGPAWLERVKFRLNQDAFRLAQRLVTWSAWAAGSLVNDYGATAEKITVIPPGVDLHAWERTSPQRSSNEHESGPVRVLFVGGDLERKGGKVLLEAFGRLQARLAAQGGALAELHLVTRDAVEPQPGVFAYHNMQPNSLELKRLFFSSDIFCLPTYGDCLPLALAEAGAAELPLVSTEVAAIPELVRPDETGLLVPPGDAEALAAALQRLVCDARLRRQLGAGALRLVRAEHDARRNAARLLALMKELADGERQRR